MNKIKDIKTTIYKWTGKIVPPSQNFCTNPTDLLREKGDKMKSFRFHEWLVCEVISDIIQQPSEQQKNLCYHLENF